MTTITTHSKRQLSKLTAELLDTNENKRVQQEYLDAIRSLDFEKLTWFKTLGDSVRKQVMNANAYEHGLLYGFTEIIFDKHGWLDNTQWTEYEEIDLNTKGELIACNKIKMACGKNGNWTYGLSYQYGATGAGGGFNPSVFDFAFETKQSCIEAAVDHLRMDFEEKISEATEQPDPTNYNIDYMKKVLKKIEDVHVTRILNQVQLNLFAA